MTCPNIRPVAFVGLAVLLLMTAPLSSQKKSQPRVMSEPVFGITYDPEKVHFDYAPSWLASRCHEKGANRKFWLYAYLKDGDTEYFVVSDRVSEESGIGFVVRGQKCSDGLPEWVLTGDAQYNGDKSIKFSAVVLKAIAQDVFRRYTAAFDGKKNFLQKVHHDHFTTADLLPPFRAEFERFEKEP